MKKLLLPLTAVCIAAFTITSCTKEAKAPVAQNAAIPSEVLAQIKALGFGTTNVQKHEDGYLVEGDIILTPQFLQAQPASQVYRVGNAEQYRTTNLVSAGGGRTIKVALDSRLAGQAGYSQALATMVSRYNAQKLLLTFQVVSSGANITFVTGNGSYLASSGFPSGGNPYNQVKVNYRAIGKGTSSTFINYLATIMAHETGHCIGFRHTDYMDRSYSCGGSTANEGASTVGAINIPGTPTTAEPNSFMLACISANQNRPFDSYDVTALNYLY
jgi:Dual-action HEIGH metallo-peptidase